MAHVRSKGKKLDIPTISWKSLEYDLSSTAQCWRTDSTNRWRHSTRFVIMRMWWGVNPHHLPPSSPWVLFSSAHYFTHIIQSLTMSSVMQIFGLLLIYFYCKHSNVILNYICVIIYETIMLKINAFFSILFCTNNIFLIFFFHRSCDCYNI